MILNDDKLDVSRHQVDFRIGRERKIAEKANDDNAFENDSFDWKKRR